MDTQSQDETVASVQDILPSASAGKILREAREAQGLSVADVAGRIKFAPRQVEALEADDFAHLPELAFVRGFVRSYARLLHLDEVVLLNALPQSSMQAAPHANAAEVPFPTAQSARRINVLWFSAAFGLAVVLGIAVLLFHDKPASKRIAETKPVEVAPVAVQAAAASAVEAASSVSGEPAEVVATPAVTVKSPVVSVKPPVVAATPQVAAAAPAVVDHPKEKPVAKTTGKGPIHLVFKTESWVDIKDKFGKTVFKQVNEPGSEQWVDGRGPFSLVIGNASGVRLYYEGEEIELKEFTDIEVARLTLD